MGLARIFWLFIGGSSLGLGTLGMFLPLLPTVPFFLLAAFGFSKSSRKIHNWLLNHKVFGPDIQNWNKYRIIRRRAKLMAISAMIASVLLALLFGVPYTYIILQIITLGFIGRFIWRQKEG